MHVRALVVDLMDRTRIGAVAANAGIEVDFVRRPDEIGADSCDLLLVDLAVEGAIGAVAALPDRACTVVGFGPHVDRARLKAAHAAGCSRVLARSATGVGGVKSGS